MSVQYALRPYQAEIGRAVLRSVLERQGLTFTVEIARQGGKNELSAQMEMLLLTLNMASGGNLVKAAPTFVPQALISMRRLKDRLKDAGFPESPRAGWVVEGGHVVRLHNARQVFVSAERQANVVGLTANHLLELDEAQDVDAEKYLKEFRPMGASTNVTTVLYGTPWASGSLLEEQKQQNLELERKDGVRRHFRYDWEEVGRHNPLYRAYVAAERERLGEEHPLFRTQYRLLPLAGGGGMFSAAQRALLQGDHARERRPQPGKTYVAALDVGGESFGGSLTPALSQRERGALFPSPLMGEGPSSGPLPVGEGAGEGSHDATVLTIGELDFSRCGGVRQDPDVRVVEHYAWTGQPQHALLPQLAGLLKDVWRCRRVVVDATGLGAGLASQLGKALGGVVEPFTFTAPSKSRLGFELLAAVNARRLVMYAGDGSPEFAEFWREVEQAGARFRPNQSMEFGVDASRGHDDYLMSLALLVKAAEYLPRVARGRAGDSAPAERTGLVATGAA